MFATCHTPGCGNAGETLEVPDDVDAVLCGVCGQKITDVAEGPPEPVTEMPSWEL